jgi:hypothetical protein
MVRRSFFLSKTAIRNGTSGNSGKDGMLGKKQ